MSIETATAPEEKLVTCLHCHGEGTTIEDPEEDGSKIETPCQECDFSSGYMTPEQAAIYKENWGI